ncbi:MAG: tRNA preQ1(34) S-adenosylmethionine ribosyltransferase-isomerase QueA [candidate division Zixibacteria bacterium]|nr:tRNA preQ1(34) S-adenosylmethionine ribosyltransferase-isomerase QueA [candidate division Zixibacteria bacterium]
MKITLKDFDYPLPKDLIAYYPSEKRDHSRLLVLERKTGTLEHKYFYEIIDYLEEGDGLIVNQTKVFPARIFGINENNQAKVEVLFLKKLEDSMWDVLVKPGKKVPSGSVIFFNLYEPDRICRSGCDPAFGGKLPDTFCCGDLRCQILGRTETGSRLAKLMFDGDLFEILERFGKIPLPPYIRREPEPQDKDRYQTVYAKEKGAVAAPTAGLHFTPELLKKIEGKGIHKIPITLHVGWDSFRPIRVDDPKDHQLESEYFKIDQTSADKINQIKENGKRIVAVGTTTVRALETVADDSGPHRIQAKSSWTKKFIYPPYKFKVVDSLITNFHLPRSTLLLLVSAFATKELILKAYQEAIRERYRFYSYGDALLII